MEERVLYQFDMDMPHCVTLSVGPRPSPRTRGGARGQARGEGSPQE
jgi:hypothetical protein